MKLRPGRVLTMLGAALLLCAAPATSQVPPGLVPINDPGDVVWRLPQQSQRWTLQLTKEVVPYERSPFSLTGRGLVVRTTGSERFRPTHIDVQDLTVMHPVLGETATSVPYPEQARIRVESLPEPWRGPRRVVPDPRLRSVDRLITNDVELLDDITGSHRFMRLEAGSFRVRSLRIEASLDVRTWRTVIDERRADAIAWPAQGYGASFDVWLAGEQGVDPDAPEIRLLLDLFLEGRSPRTYRPYKLAKVLASKTVEYVLEIPDNRWVTRLREDAGAIDSVDDFVFERRTLDVGPVVGSSVGLARSRRGSTHSVAAFLCAIYRAAGLPARLVIGLDEAKRAEFGQDATVLRSWVEFALVDETRGVTEWVPADVGRQREFSNRPPPLTQPWQFFGNHQESQFLIPMSHHWSVAVEIEGEGIMNAGGWHLGGGAHSGGSTSRRLTASPTTLGPNEPFDQYAW